MQFTDLIRKFNEFYFSKITYIHPLLFIIYFLVFSFYIRVQYKKYYWYYYGNKVVDVLVLFLQSGLKILLVLILHLTSFIWLCKSVGLQEVSGITDNFLFWDGVYTYENPEYWEWEIGWKRPTKKPYIWENGRCWPHEYKNYQYRDVNGDDNLKILAPYYTWRPSYKTPEYTIEEVNAFRIKYLNYLHEPENGSICKNVCNETYPGYVQVDKNNLPSNYYDNRPGDYFKPENQFYAVKPLLPYHPELIPSSIFKDCAVGEMGTSLRFTTRPPSTLVYEELNHAEANWRTFPEPPNTTRFDEDVYLYKIAGFNERRGMLIIEPVVYKKKKYLDIKADLYITVDYIPLFESWGDDFYVERLVQAFGCKNFKELYEKSCRGEILQLMERPVTPAAAQKQLHPWHPAHSVLVLNDFYGYHMLEENIDHPENAYHDMATNHRSKHWTFTNSTTPLSHWRNYTKEAIEMAMTRNLQVYYNMSRATENWYNLGNVGVYEESIKPTTMEFLFCFTGEGIYFDSETSTRNEGPFGRWMFEYLHALAYNRLRPFYEHRFVAEDMGMIWMEEYNFHANYVLQRLPIWANPGNVFIEEYVLNALGNVYFTSLMNIKACPYEEWNDYAKIRYFLIEHLTYFGSMRQRFTGVYFPEKGFPEWMVAVLLCEIAPLMMRHMGI